MIQRSKYFKMLIVVGFSAVLTIFFSSNSYSYKWERTFGGADWGEGRSVQQTVDGCFIIAGFTGNPIPTGERDVYLIKTDASGDELWSKTFGGTSPDWGLSVQHTADGGFIIAGSTYSFGAGDKDVYLIKTDASGDELWSKTFGGAGYDDGHSVQQTSDGGFIIAGNTRSFGAGNHDVYLIKTDASGDELWSKTFGGAGNDWGLSVQQTDDGGFIITGWTDSFGAGDNDVYLIKTDASGVELWSKTFGGAGYDDGYSVQQTDDGGFIITGRTDSFGAGLLDVYLIKTDASGDELWSKTFGGGHYDDGFSVQQTDDGGFIIAGDTRSFGAGLRDVYLIKTDTSGDKLWSKTFGGAYWDFGYSVQQTADGGFIIAGWTDSFGTGSYDYDVYLIYYNPVKPQMVTLLTPNGGEIIPSGSGYTIEWDAAEEVETFKLKYSMDNGATWEKIADGILGMIYPWEVPTPNKNKANCLIKAIGYDASGKKVGKDKSDGPFTIEVLTVTSPTEGDTLTSGETHTITWTTNETKAEVAKVKLLYTKNGGKTWKKIDTIEGYDPETYIWTVPDVPKIKSKCRVKVVLKDENGKTGAKAISDGYFTIQP